MVRDKCVRNTFAELQTEHFPGKVPLERALAGDTVAHHGNMWAEAEELPSLSSPSAAHRGWNYSTLFSKRGLQPAQICSARGNSRTLGSSKAARITLPAWGPSSGLSPPAISAKLNIHRALISTEQHTAPCRPLGHGSAEVAASPQAKQAS